MRVAQSEQVGGIIGALCTDLRKGALGRSMLGDKVGLRCSSLKANMGHLEACAAAAGLASLMLAPLCAMSNAGNAQLRRSGVSEEESSARESLLLHSPLVYFTCVAIDLAVVYSTGVQVKYPYLINHIIEIIILLSACRVRGTGRM